MSRKFIQIENRVARFVAFAVGGVVLVTVFCVVMGLLVQWLWNVTLVELFGWPSLSYWQALGVLLLAKLFFGFGGGHGQYGGPRRHKRARHEHAAASGKRESAQAAAPTDVDDSFREFWAAEGSAAYAAFRERRGGGSHRADEQSSDA